MRSSYCEGGGEFPVINTSVNVGMEFTDFFNDKLFKEISADFSLNSSFPILLMTFKVDVSGGVNLLISRPNPSSYRSCSPFTS